MSRFQTRRSATGNQAHSPGESSAGETQELIRFPWGRVIVTGKVGIRWEWSSANNCQD
ncbi:hypothetical protein NG799_26385 [Laspinema sp. D1]|uniref:Uncharacterized protein n=1 Tax=Laspinema palackyanum D2a TaxID=2953684 RepID=A0ABT2MYL0_9CYAN|nr:hypothetical protein [Laspinema sp. D2a]